MSQIKLHGCLQTVVDDMLAIWPDELSMGKAVHYYHGLEMYENDNQFMSSCIWQIARFMWRRDDWKFYDEMRTKYNPSDGAIFNLYKKAFLKAYHGDPLYVMRVYEWEDTCRTMKEECAYQLAREQDITVEEARDILREVQYQINEAKEVISDYEKLLDVCYDIFYEYTHMSVNIWLKFFVD